jgi:hypothetical protein
MKTSHRLPRIRVDPGAHPTNTYFCALVCPYRGASTRVAEDAYETRRQLPRRCLALPGTSGTFDTAFCIARLSYSMQIPLTSTDEGGDLVPFHKLTGWMTYSLIVPIEKILGWKIEGTEDLVGLPEYRNGDSYAAVSCYVRSRQAQEDYSWILESWSFSRT